MLRHSANAMCQERGRKMRLIDADALLERFNEKADMAECLVDEKTAERFAFFCKLADAVDDAPTIDAVPVVRCKYCKWYKAVDLQLLPGIKMCHRHANIRGIGKFVTTDNDYCSFGVRKDLSLGIKTSDKNNR